MTNTTTSNKSLREMFISRIIAHAQGLEDQALFDFYEIMQKVELICDKVAAADANRAATTTRGAKRSKKKAATASTTTSTPTTPNSTESGTQTTKPTFGSLITQVLTKTPQRPVEIAQKLFDAKLVPALDAKMKNRVAITLSVMAKRKVVAKAGSNYALL